MRMSVLSKSRLPVARFVGAALLASVATGCSSDATRFSSVFNEDTLTTASIGNRNITGLNGGVPVPSADVASSGGYAQSNSTPDYSNRQQAMSQPYPSAPARYDASGSASPARMATQPSTVERAELAAPSAPAARQTQSRETAMAQPFPSAPASKPKSQPIVPEDAIVTGSTPSSSARNAAQPANFPTKLPAPAPRRQPEDNVAVLPTSAQTREKQQALAQPVPSKSSAGGNDRTAGTYKVQPGDSLGKIASANGVSVDALKQANGLTNSNIRIGQNLKVPGAAPVQASAPAPEVKTASVPTKPVKIVKASEPASYTPPSQTVKQVAAIDTKDKAPEETGIGKYRWPVTGAVVSRFGQNAGGKRNDGIDISVPSGTPVKAAENGVVIYAGNGLKELGNTVLVRHNDGTVTVYGHADTLSVNRGQKVQRGQQLALSGMSGSAERPLLHFEVRKDATPVDPMTFLD